MALYRSASTFAAAAAEPSGAPSEDLSSSRRRSGAGRCLAATRQFRDGGRQQAARNRHKHKHRRRVQGLPRDCASEIEE